MYYPQIAPSKRYDDFDINEIYRCTDPNELIAKIDKCVLFISNIKDPARAIDDRRALKVMLFLRRNSVNNPDLAKSLLNQKSAIKILINIIVYYKNELRKFLLSYGTQQNHHTESYERYYFHQFDFMNELLLMISNVTNESKTFCYKFHDQQGTKSLLDYLEDVHLIRKLIKLKQKNVKTSFVDEVGYRLLLRIIQTVHNISVIAEYRKMDFEQLKITTIIRNIIEYIHPYDDARILTYITLTNVVNDTEIETLPDTKSALDDIVKLIRIAADCIFQGGMNLVRIKIDIDIDEENEVLNEVTQLPGGWHLISLLIALYHLAINDRIKYDIYETHSVHAELEKIIEKGNSTEQEYAARLLWQLCFDKRIAKKVHAQDHLYSLITNLANTEDSNKNLIKYCKGILWSIQKVIQDETLALSNDANYSSQLSEDNVSVDALNQLVRTSVRPFIKGDNKSCHIMISYNSHNRDLCLKIKSALEALHYNVWIDVENISGSSLESMARAVENSTCVLMCMTEKYKQSPNCRAEAEYAFKINVPIIPLIMQEQFMPDGWLGIILGSKIFINFTKYNFDECMRRLLNELKSIDLDYCEDDYDDDDDEEEEEGENSDLDRRQSKVTTNSQDDEMKSIKNWKNLDVQNWLYKSNIQNDIIKNLRNFNGELLVELNLIRQTAPEYFFKTISSNDSLDLFSVVHFSNELQKIFND